MQVVPYPFEPDETKRRPEIPIGTCSPLPRPAVVKMPTPAGALIDVLDGTAADLVLVDADLTVHRYTLTPSDEHSPDGVTPRGAEWGHGAAANIAGVLLVHSGTVTIQTDDGSTEQVVQPGRWVLR